MSSLKPEEKSEIYSEAARSLAAEQKGVVWTVSAPCTLTVKSRSDGRYKKKPFIGEEELTLIDAYVGKRGTPILVFEFSDELYVEIAVGDLYKHINCASELIEEIRMAVEKAQMGEIRAQAPKEMDEVVLTPFSPMKANPNFGSW